MWDVLLEFSPDVDLNQVCEALMDTEYWMGISCHIRCEILDMEHLGTVRQSCGLLQPRMLNGLTPMTNRLFLFLALWGGFICNEELARPRGPTSNSHMVPLGALYTVYTAAV